MKKKLLSLALAFVLAFCAFCAGALTKNEASEIAKQVTETTTDKSQITSPFIGVIDKVQKSVVGINNYQNYTYSSYGNQFGFGFGYGNRGNRSSQTVERLAATGSGVVVYDGLVLTNFHVVEKATRLTISVLGEENEYECILVSYDEAKDLAVVYAADLSVEPVQLGDSEQLQVGEWVMCIGNPLTDELKGTVTVGIISALDREISSETVTDRYGLKTENVNTMIQTDAAINEGNSGGGLFNTLGQLMGVPSMKMSSGSYNRATVEGIGLAIPVNTAKPIISEAIIKVLTGSMDNTAPESKTSDDNTASVSADKPMLGVTGAMVNQNNSYAVYAGKLPAGMMLEEVQDGSPAALAKVKEGSSAAQDVGDGLKHNDIIVEIDGKIASSFDVIREVLASHSYGDTIDVKVYRSEGFDDARTLDDIKGIGYIDYTIELFKFNVES
ncbi:MAG: trypsin-like peptidase domain-containing protein [Clostridiales bacterium]|nr:trypsin-like peptidase domain-containing protein [Clostridiales bacterium]